jgi:hypothetical protein
VMHAMLHIGVLWSGSRWLDVVVRGSRHRARAKNLFYAVPTEGRFGRERASHPTGRYVNHNRDAAAPCRPEGRYRSS